MMTAVPGFSMVHASPLLPSLAGNAFESETDALYKLAGMAVFDSDRRPDPAVADLQERIAKGGRVRRLAQCGLAA
jgi:hypothetical protein